VIEKFEEHYGSKVTKGLLGLIALAIVAVCVSMIWQWLVSPVLAFFKSPERLRFLIQLLYLGAAMGFGTVVARLSARRWTREGRASREEFDRAIERSNQAAEELKLAAEGLGRTLTENETRLLVVDKNSTPEHLRNLAQQLEEQAKGLEATRNLSEAPTPPEGAEEAPSR
jgi:hypothetical protein